MVRYGQSENVYGQVSPWLTDMTQTCFPGNPGLLLNTREIGGHVLAGGLGGGRNLGVDRACNFKFTSVASLVVGQFPSPQGILI